MLIWYSYNPKPADFAEMRRLRKLKNYLIDIRNIKCSFLCRATVKSGPICAIRGTTPANSPHMIRPIKVKIGVIGEISGIPTTWVNERIDN
jgi:hypothetical protein